jgi:hypothetical protein
MLKPQRAQKKVGHLLDQIRVRATNLLGVTAFDRRELAGTNEGRRGKARIGIGSPERNVFRPCSVFGACDHRDPEQASVFTEASSGDNQSRTPLAG